MTLWKPAVILSFLSKGASDC